MSLVGTRLSLIHLCTIERDQNAGTTTGGWADPPRWQAHLTDQPCRFWTKGGREDVTDKDSIVAVDQQMMIVSLGTDVTDQDRVSAAGVTYRGDTIVTGPIGIRAINPKKDHLELVLEQIGS